MRIAFFMTDQSFPVSFKSEDERIGIDFSGYIGSVSGETYHGPYEAIPSQSEQVFLTGGLIMTDNFRVKPIPNNYGLITYNGFCLTVS